MELSPLTGRTHQLRAHMLALGCPILGDPKYRTEASVARSAGLKLQLHARRLVLPHPSGRRAGRDRADRAGDARGVRAVRVRVEKTRPPPSAEDGGGELKGWRGRQVTETEYVRAARSRRERGAPSTASRSPSPALRAGDEVGRRARRGLHRRRAKSKVAHDHDLHRRRRLPGAGGSLSRRPPLRPAGVRGLQQLDAHAGLPVDHAGGGGGGAGYRRRLDRRARGRRATS